MTKKTSFHRDRSVRYDDWLVKQLKDINQAAAYLNAALMESSDGEVSSRKAFLIALSDVVNAQGGIDKISKKSKISRDTVCKILNGKVKPEIYTLTNNCAESPLDRFICGMNAP
jgi:DNA-binding phage protein